MQDKLRNVLAKYVDDTDTKDIELLISDIQKAFADEQGFHDTHYEQAIRRFCRDKGLSDTSQKQLEAIIEARYHDLMTGQEWYDRFERELEHVRNNQKKRPVAVFVFDHNEIDEAARKAAGLDT